MEFGTSPTYFIDLYPVCFNLYKKILLLQGSQEWVYRKKRHLQATMDKDDTTENEGALWRRAVRDVEPLKKSRRGLAGPQGKDAAGQPQEQESGPLAGSTKKKQAKAQKNMRDTGAEGEKGAFSQFVPSFLQGRQNKSNHSGNIENTAPQIDRQTARKLDRGQMPIDARIDLHGMTQRQAHQALKTFILNAAAQGYRCVLVITGKGKVNLDPDPYPSYGDAAFADGGMEKPRPGVIKRQLPHWLADSDIQPHILRAQEAHIKHGGAGATYIYLRRRRGA